MGKISFALTTAISLWPALASSAGVNQLYLTHPYRNALELSSALTTAAPKKLEYYGGPVLANPVAYAVMWGSNVNPEVESKIGGMLTSTLASTYMDMLSQYSTGISAVGGQPGTNQTIGHGTFGGNFRLQPSNLKTDLDDTEVGAELEAQIESGKLPKPDANTLYFLYFPPEVSITVDGAKSCVVFCGYHHSVKTRNYGQVFYAVQPDQGGACAMGCSAGSSTFESMSVVTSHELAEAVTDPSVESNADLGPPIGWVTNQGSEIGDLCASQLTTVAAKNGTVYRVQQAFDNSIHRCNKGPFRE